MKNNSIKTVVATGIGAALFIIIGTLVNIPTPIIERDGRTLRAKRGN